MKHLSWLNKSTWFNFSFFQFHMFPTFNCSKIICNWNWEKKKKSMYNSKLEKIINKILYRVKLWILQSYCHPPIRSATFSMMSCSFYPTSAAKAFNFSNPRHFGFLCIFILYQLIFQRLYFNYNSGASYCCKSYFFLIYYCRGYTCNLKK